MTVDTTQFREMHASLRDQTDQLRLGAVELPDLTPAERSQLRERILTFLRETVEPHTRLDERLLYPEIASRLGDPLATAPMAYDHLAIRYWINQIAEADLERPEPLQELLYGLDALIRVHVWKENELYLRMLDSPSWPDGS